LRWDYFQSLVKENKIPLSDCSTFQLAMLWASVGNTLPAVFWVMYFISTNEHVKKTVLEEIDSIYASIPAASEYPLLSQKHLDSMKYTDACITESLRLSSGSMIMRYVKQPCELTLASGKSYKFRKGDKIGICPPLTHLDADVFPSAYIFNPDRWLCGDNEEEISNSSCGKLPNSALSKDGKSLSTTYAFLPFGGGPTYCPGRRFARNEIKIVLVYLLRYFSVDVLFNDAGVDAGMKTPSKVAGTGLGGSNFPGFDGSRAGLGIFPPKKMCKAEVSMRK